jgi:gephyrin
MALRTLRVHGTPKLALASTGDELVDVGVASSASSSPNEPPRLGEIYDANRPMLAAAAVAAGVGVDDVVDLGVVRDDPAALARCVAAALDANADIIVTTGGVSEGDRDHLKEVLSGESAACVAAGIAGVVRFGRVAMKPGKPLTFAEVRRTRTDSDGRDADGHVALVFALPGNPVSAAVTFQLVVVPTLRRMLGWADPRLRRIRCRLEADVRLDAERPEYHRATLRWETPCAAPPGVASTADDDDDDDADEADEANAYARSLPVAQSTGRQISSRLSSMTGADVLLELPRGPGTARGGERRVSARDRGSARGGDTARAVLKLLRVCRSRRSPRLARCGALFGRPGRPRLASRRQKSLRSSNYLITSVPTRRDSLTSRAR